MDFKTLKNYFDNYKIGFVQIRGYEKPITEKFKQGQGEISDVKINVGFNYGNAIDKDIKIFETTEIPYIESNQYTREHWEDALQCIKNSLTSPSKNHSQGQQEAYIYLTKNGSVQFCKKTKNIHIFAMVENKIIIREGEYREENSRPKTIAKKRILKYLKDNGSGLYTKKVRRYIVDRISTLKMNGETLEIGL